MTDYEEFDSIEEMVGYLENEYSITVLALRDYGSRAWNLDSETSDMDAGMVFRQEPMDYIELGGYTQNIDRKFFVDGEEFELIGWNIKRFAELLNKSNPSMIEWLNSEITYYEDNGEMQYIKSDLKDKEFDIKFSIFDELQSHANQEFKPISLFYHYRSMAKDNYQKYIVNRNDLRIKRHLYILRGLLYSKYVLETHRRPLLDFPKFCDEHLDELDIPEFIQQYTKEFIRKKKNGDGDTEIADEELWNWMRNEINRGEDINHEKHDVRGISKEKINEWMRRMTPAR